MEFIKEEIEDMSDPEPSRIKHEDTEEQIDRMEVKEERQELEEFKEEHHNFKIQETKAKELHTCTRCLFMQRSRSLTAKRLHSEPIAYGDSEDSPGILPRLPFLEADGGISFSLRYKKSYPASARVIHRRRRKEGS
ncbi:unnamed protein product [Leuciscus chuanchicus]